MERRLRRWQLVGVKAVDAVGPMPPPGIKDGGDPDYPACVKRSADKITAWEYKYSPYVDDCMLAASYHMTAECVGLGFSAILRAGADCYE
jgi:hypothetical protein